MYVVITISHKLSSNTLAYAHDATVKVNISNSIFTNETVNGSCNVIFKEKQPDVYLCNKMRIGIMQNNAGADTCNVHKVSTKVQLVSGCKTDFTVLCSKSNISVNLFCFLSHNREAKRIKGRSYKINALFMYVYTCAAIVIVI